MKLGIGYAALVLWIGVGVAGCHRHPRTVPIEVGGQVEGTLAPDDWTDVFGDGSYADLYEVRLDAGQRITVELSSTSFDTYLSLLRGPGDQLIDNDDLAPGNNNSRLTYTAQATGRYYLAATSYRPGASGPYTLRVSAAAEEPPPAGEESPAKQASPPLKTRAERHDGEADR